MDLSSMVAKRIAEMKQMTSDKPLPYEVDSSGKAKVNARQYARALDELDRLINPDLGRDPEGRLINMKTGKPCFDNYHAPDGRRRETVAEWRKRLGSRYVT